MAAEVEENGQFKKLLQATWSNVGLGTGKWLGVGSQARHHFPRFARKWRSFF